MRNAFSWRARFRSFVCAWDGVVSFFRCEHNAYVHFVLTVATVILGLYLGISGAEFIALVITMALVRAAEVFNTAIERSMDFISNENHPQIKIIKDLAAAAVLITATAAVVVGLIIFLPKLF